MDPTLAGLSFRAWRVGRRSALAWDWQGTTGSGPLEQAAVLAATDDVVREGAVSAQSWSACERELHCDKVVLIELVTVISAWRMVASILHTAFEVPLEDGVSSWPPDGLSPR